MESIQRRFSYLILTFALVSPLISWAQFDLASSAHTDITCNNIDEGITNDGTITLTSCHGKDRTRCRAKGIYNLRTGAHTSDNV